MTALGAWDPKQPQVERFKLLVEDLQLGDTGPGLGQLVSDQMPEAIALGQTSACGLASS